ncbi:unnamed protein product [Linum tenue]|uniref:Uncharacterized protein n=1 Tax=Linum tenue TaxID=586396 RepID=A0AAV0HXA1_9ROSI|nr:unnamed protein product [Linum tenue]
MVPGCRRDGGDTAAFADKSTSRCWHDRRSGDRPRVPMRGWLQDGETVVGDGRAEDSRRMIERIVLDSNQPIRKL